MESAPSHLGFTSIVVKLLSSDEVWVRCLGGALLGLYSALGNDLECGRDLRAMDDFSLGRNKASPIPTCMKEHAVTDSYEGCWERRSQQEKTLSYSCVYYCRRAQMELDLTAGALSTDMSLADTNHTVTPMKPTQGLIPWSGSIQIDWYWVYWNDCVLKSLELLMSGGVAVTGGSSSEADGASHRMLSVSRLLLLLGNCTAYFHNYNCEEHCVWMLESGSSPSAFPLGTSIWFVSDAWTLFFVC